MVQALSRRDRVRAETTEEIKETARRILVEQGPKAVTLRAIARDMGVKMAAACQGFRQWALAHKAEFALLFGTPLPGINIEDDDFCEECARRFAGTFFTLFLELWQKNPFPVPPPEEIEPGLREQLARYRDGIGAEVPLGALLVFLRCWVRLYGIVSMEVFGHLGFALDDPAPIFEITLAELASLVGLRYPAS